jgi:hypothetical protein
MIEADLSYREPRQAHRASGAPPPLQQPHPQCQHVSGAAGSEGAVAAAGEAAAGEAQQGGGGSAGGEPEPEQPPFSWSKGELVGVGAFGRVFKGLNNDTGEIIAIKQVGSKVYKRDRPSTWRLPHLPATPKPP